MGDKQLKAMMPALEAEYPALVKQVPTQSPIFLPTERIALPDRIAGLKRVKAIYDTALDAQYRPKLRALRERFKGHQRCFIIGNGPSLNRTDLDCLRGEVTFAVNGFFLKAREIGWQPTFYVVEDHLVAEDRREWINALKGPTKLFPAYLGYCMQPGDDTIFFNHRPRKSYPHGFDFSTDAAQLTYAGCTVTFTSMQLAFYMGFREIYLIGVDADYDLPKDVEHSKSYGVGVLDMKSDDPNHFHPDYFGKGFRWHDPQVEKMVEAYGEARRVTEETSDQRIYNATVGGKLEVFERRAFASLFSAARRGEELEAERIQREAFRAKAKLSPFSDAPRLLLIDMTLIGDGTATGEVKANLFGNWPADRLLQVFANGASEIKAWRWAGNKAQVGDGGEQIADPAAISAAIDAFEPELILYRPVPGRPALHAFAMETIDRLPVALAVSIMDDWPSELAATDPGQATVMDQDWRVLVERARVRLSICEAMSKAFEQRYGQPFQAFANAIDPGDWPRPRNRPPGPFKIRYAGSLADNMTLDSILRVAAAVEALRQTGHDIAFEIRTREYWANITKERFATLAATTFSTEELTVADYRAWLSDADVGLIAYNFDEASTRYVRLSLANKLPECLASGAVLLAHGPRGIATIDYLSTTGGAVIVDRPDVEALRAALEGLIRDPFRRLDLADAAQKVAFTRHRIDHERERLQGVLSAAVGGSRFSAPRARHAHVDETHVVAHLLADRTGDRHVMLDVGAHFGGSALPFAEAGWRVFCFEPDPSNRKKLEARVGGRANVLIDTRAVSDAPATGVSFFTSQESTGISGLHAFRETHVESHKVDVTTVGAILDQHGLDRVDFLKIDVEGFDFGVLKGVPWDRLRPEVIECEFEDAKTRKMGHTYREVCDYLVARGYTVYLSEWHPIVRYGIKHDWRQLVRYPAPLASSDGWGNVLAFLQDPGEAVLRDAFAATMSLTTAPTIDDLRTALQATSPGAPRSVGRASQPGGKRPQQTRTEGALMSQYGRFAEWAQESNPLVFRLGQFAMWTARTAARHKGFVAAGLAVVAAVALAAVALGGIAGTLAGFALTALLVLGLLSAVLGYIGHLQRVQADIMRVRDAAFQRTIQGLEKRLSETGSKLSALDAAGQQTSKALQDANKAFDQFAGRALVAPSADHQGGYRFNRQLTDEHVRALTVDWTARLGTELSPSAARYMAGRARWAESLLQGRLATAIEDILLRTLVVLSVQRRSVDVLEIGTLFGTGAAIIYDGARSHFDTLHLTLLDPLDGYYQSGNDILTGLPINEIMLRRNLSHLGVPDGDVTIVKHFSTESVAQQAAEQRLYDVLIIDGDHTYKGIKADFEFYAHTVRPGGYIVFDDYSSPSWPDVQQFVDREVAGRADVQFVGHAWRTCVYRVTQPISRIAVPAA